LTSHRVVHDGWEPPLPVPVLVAPPAPPVPVLLPPPLPEADEVAPLLPVPVPVVGSPLSPQPATKNTPITAAGARSRFMASDATALW
jgi:hypothetical protein